MTKYAAISDQWSPKFVAEFNDNPIELAKVEGTFDSHTHDDTDEVFLWRIAGDRRREREPAPAVHWRPLRSTKGCAPTNDRRRRGIDVLIEPADTPSTETAANEAWNQLASSTESTNDS